MEKHVKEIIHTYIHHTKKSLLLDAFHTWIKKQEGLFGVSMGVYGEAEVCELAGTYM